MRLQGHARASMRSPYPKSYNFVFLFIEDICFSASAPLLLPLQKKHVFALAKEGVTRQGIRAAVA